ncbi:GTPase [Pararhodobacter marinus]|uniref:G domain-containing protein n=1 Tax=Pararhodobacter marinus TaxID=2184063 RepID=A0A2U2CCM6_9RHOB|nr:GTPase [Pararhodobacter marinus]PWE29544.1 hypothetical protein C4N9_07290 [Pararhodobacter marinus]
MTLGERLRHTLLRWDKLGLAAILALPLTLSMLLGFLYLHEHGYLLWFALGTALFYAGFRGAVFVARWRTRAAGERVPREVEGPKPDPEWTEAEKAAFARARARIDRRLSEPIPWATLPAEALSVVEEVATDLSDGRRSALDFTLPEALMLVDQVALRYRAFLLEHVPYSDKLSVRTMHWLWRKQDAALSAWETGFLAWRGVRLVMNPAVGLLREAERVLATGLQDRLTDKFRRDAQAILLEESAQAAIDLYSGRLKVSEQDLTRLGARVTVPDARPEGAVQIVIVGQTSAGKSTLLNALLEEDSAETDAAPTTEAASGHMTESGVRLIDTPGLDGTDRMARAIAAQMVAADLVIWVHRANRPGRAADTALQAAFDAAMTRDPARRHPPVIHVANAADLLLPGWPRPENTLTAEDRATLDAAAGAIAQAMGPAVDPRAVIPIRAEAPDWNIDALDAAIDAVLPEARMTRRNRLRLEGAAGQGLRGNLTRARRGAGALVRALGSRWR